MQASMLYLEDNYYRVSLAGNGSLRLRGTLTNENWTYSAAVSATVYNMAQQSQGTILNQRGAEQFGARSKR